MGALTTPGRPSRPRGPHLAGLTAVVAAGGAVGTTVRALLEDRWPAPPGGWPWTTFAINLVGSVVLGALLETLVRSRLGDERARYLRLALGTGVLGGFTTYSTFVVEVERRLSGGFVTVAATYALASVALGIAGACAGVVLARRGHRARVRARATRQEVDA